MANNLSLISDDFPAILVTDSSDSIPDHSTPIKVPPGYELQHSGLGNNSLANRSLDSILSQPSVHLDSFCLESESEQCQICLSDLHPSHFFILKQCHCKFCRECLVNYAYVQIMDGCLSIPCPSMCYRKKGIVTDAELRLLVCQQVYLRYLNSRQQAEIFSNPHMTVCPGAACRQVVALLVAKHSGSQAAQCHSCDLLFCAYCHHYWQENHQCGAIEISIGQTLGKNQRSSGWIRKCPSPSGILMLIMGAILWIADVTGYF